MATKYVKFSRGSSVAFNAVQVKDTDTLYFITDSDSQKSSLYLGDKLVTNNANSIVDLEDILTSELKDKQLLIYNEEKQVWENKSITDAIGLMAGCSADEPGKIGLVPAPAAGQEDYFLAGDGSWKKADLDKYVEKVEGSRLITTAEVAKLEEVEKNYINSVSSDFIVSEARELSLNDLSIDKIIGLDATLKSKVDAIENWTLLSPENQKILEKLVIDEDGSVGISGSVNADNVQKLDEWITKKRDEVDGLLSAEDEQKLLSIEAGAQKNFITSVNENQFLVSDIGELSLKNTYLELSVYQTEVGNLEDLVHASGKENSTLVEELNSLNERMSWHEL